MTCAYRSWKLRLAGWIVIDLTGTIAMCLQFRKGVGKWSGALSHLTLSFYTSISMQSSASSPHRNIVICCILLIATYLLKHH
jgi:hypothetical protein